MTRAAYIDTSVVAALFFGESEAVELWRRLKLRADLLSSDLLETEVRSAVARDGTTAPVDATISSLAWIRPTRRLGPEYDRILARGYLRGANLYHVACALYADPSTLGIDFITLDERQREVAEAVGFLVT